jgi:SAM-dependent methyltransferase
MDEFTGKATVYDKARPGYAPAALDFILGLVNNPQAISADIGAGTGKFSSMLAARGYDVIAVEPNADMRSKLPVLKNLCVLDGTAEATGLPDHSVDAVTCAQAFHWFDAEKFKAECVRILKPGGQIFVVYNNPVGNYRHDELIWYRTADSRSDAAWHAREERLRDFFGGALTRTAFPNPICYDAEGWLAYMLSHSHSPRPGDEVYERFVEGVRLIFERNHENSLMRMQFETTVYTA